MKKQTILLLAGGLLALASCGDGGKADAEKAQKAADSMKNAMEMQAKEQAMKDSMTAVMNAQKASADSAAAAMKAEEEKKAGAKGGHHEHGGSGKTTAQPAAPAPVKSAQDAKFDSRQGGNGTTKSALTPDQQKAQDDKFNRRGK